MYSISYKTFSWQCVPNLLNQSDRACKCERKTVMYCMGWKTVMTIVLFCLISSIVWIIINSIHCSSAHITQLTHIGTDIERKYIPKHAYSSTHSHIHYNLNWCYLPKAHTICKWWLQYKEQKQVPILCAGSSGWWIRLSAIEWESVTHIEHELSSTACRMCMFVQYLHVCNFPFYKNGTEISEIFRKQICVQLCMFKEKMLAICK